MRVDSRLDVPTAVYEHAVICEYAHARLLERAARRSSLISFSDAVRFLG
jgi:hypothetical protein